MTIDETYMLRCLELAELGKGFVMPNPMVGSVIVYNNKIIGEGYHQQFGKSHAEVNAIESVSDKKLLEDSTLYVNLEPCSHWGKTPPCADLIIRHSIPKVVIGSVDSHLKVSGKGIQRMREAGIDVKIGVLEQECKMLNKRFFSFHEQQRPYVILKWAQTRDGFIDIAPHLKTSAKGVWITNELCRKLVHKWRAEEASIMVGTNTARTDNPSLTTRNWAGNNPLRITIDKNLTLPQNLHILDGAVPTLIFTETSIKSTKGISYIYQQHITVSKILQELYNRNILSVIVEGGSILLQSFIDSGLWDEARVFTGQGRFGDGVAAPDFRWNSLKTETIGDSRLDWFYNK